MPAYRTESCTINRPEDVEQDWLDLQQQASHSYFQSWGWVGTWLTEIVGELQPVIVRVWADDTLVGLGIFVSRDIKRRGLFYARAMYLNEYPFDGNNMVIEYNGLLAGSGHEAAVYKETINHLLVKYKNHDEFCFGAMLEASTPFALEASFVENVNQSIYETSVARYVDLSEVQPGLDNYLSSLSRNRRTQIRRALKLYDEDGSLRIDEARNIDQAQFYFDKLKVLHTEYWQSKSKRGSFANPLWETFHRGLINSRFGFGEIQLLKVSNSCGEIGFIYNFVMDKHVYVVQTGFKRTDDKRLMPGYVAHALAINFNRSRGMLVYDLMHGDTLYKQLLCNKEQTLQWVVIQRKRLKFTVENTVVSIVRWLRGR